MIEAACRECGYLDIFVYSNPDMPAYPVIYRSFDLEKTVQPNKMIDPYGCTLRTWSFTGRDGAPLNSDRPAAHHAWIKDRYEKYIGQYRSDGKRTPDVVIGSEPYIPAFAKALDSYYIEYKRIRGMNSSRIRRAPFDWESQEWMPPLVAEYYRNNYCERVAFIGAESTGKSTIAAIAAKELKGAYVPEYGAEYFKKKGGVLAKDSDWDHIVEKQVELEDVLHANPVYYRYLMCDTEAITTKLFAHWMIGHSTSEVDLYAKEAKSRYKHWFLCDDGIPFDGSNMRGPEEIRKMHQGILKMMLEDRGIKYVELTGSIGTRLLTVMNVLEERRERDWDIRG
jgi:NadR type nicotinamide-nucleotide adenylyltransferase